MGAHVRTDIALNAVFGNPVWHSHRHIPLLKGRGTGGGMSVGVRHKYRDGKLISLKSIDCPLDVVYIVLLLFVFPFHFFPKQIVALFADPALIGFHFLYAFHTCVYGGIILLHYLVSLFPVGGFYCLF